MKVAVIGAGLSSLSFARNLLKTTNKEISISLFEKSRGVGGRLATRRANAGESEVTFDHGAPYFTIRDPNFLHFAEKEEGAAVIQEWKASIKQINEKNEVSELREQTLKRYVGCPGNNAIPKIICSTLQKTKNLTLNTQVQIAKLKRVAPREWKLITQTGEEISDTFELVVISAPAEQACQMIKASEGFEAEHSKEKILKKLSTFSMNPCWALMVAFKQHLNPPFDAAFVNNPNSAFRWIANNSSKVQRRNSNNMEYDCWVAHTTVEWSKLNLEKSPEEVKLLLLQELKSLMKPHVEQVDTIEPVILEAHRWRYSIPANIGSSTSEAPYLLYEDLGIGFIGDWCSAGRIEGAFMSGFHLAEFIKSKL